MQKLTPMMQQYMEIKQEYKEYILFFRLGDFYEMFFDDAIKAVEVLGIALTGRDCGLSERAPMAGIPHHAADTYIARLVEGGLKVAICEQVEDPKEAKGIVKRAVTRIVTPATVNTDQLEATTNAYILAYIEEKGVYGLAFSDLSTGVFSVTLLPDKTSFIDELARLEPREIITPQTNPVMDIIEAHFQIKPFIFDPWVFDENTAKKALEMQLKTQSLDGFGLDEGLIISVAGGLLAYLRHTQQDTIHHLQSIQRYYQTDFMHVDQNTRRHLELTETLQEQQKKGSLWWILDHTKTSMGARKLRQWITEPLLDLDDINDRLDCVDEFKSDPLYRNEVKELLDPILDLERLISKITYKTANGRDLVGLSTSIEQLPLFYKSLKQLNSPLGKKLTSQLDLLSDIHLTLSTALLETPPISIREGNIFSKGYHENLDKLREAKESGNQWLLDLEAREKEKSGIKNLKIKYNRIFGYFLEVTNSNLDMVPSHYIRRQTLANSERYSIDELKEIEETILGAEEKMEVLEYELFMELIDYLTNHISRIQLTASILASIDCLQSFGEGADIYDFSKPQMNNGREIILRDSRHPVVERFSSHFVPNDVNIGSKEAQLLLITGPNMAGKSTYMRQVALIVLMAQCGSFIPAGHGEIGIVDRIFTRIGASDNLSMGQSTFMVEMNEMANILHHATSQSLLILDEIGRGTSTYDGLAIAWAILEYVATNPRLQPKTFFATHYHELTDLEKHIEGVQNLSVSVLEQGEDILFLHTIEKGPASGSYGVEVAKLAGLPKEVIHRAREILAQLTPADDLQLAKTITKKDIVYYKEKTTIPPVNHELLNEFLDIDVNGLSPIDVSQQVQRLQKKYPK